MNTSFKLAASLAVLALLLGAASLPAADSASDKERQLLDTLRTGAPAEKAVTCKHLAIHGTSASVPELAKLLGNEQLASWSRIALEAIPGKEADEALRNATHSLQGKLLVGVINSIGVRRDAAATQLLADRLEDKDSQVAAAAAIALGQIGTPAAAKPLRQALAAGVKEVRTAAAEGCILCAERSQEAGKAADAVALYDEVRKADVARQRILSATRGAILARNQDGIPLLIEQLRSPDKAFFQIGLSTAREFPGAEVDKALAKELGQAAPERAPLLIAAMADRPDTVVMAALSKAAAKGQPAARLAAIGALGRLGDATSLAALLDIATEPDAELSQAARAALATLPDKKADSEIASRLANAQGKAYPVLIELVGLRRIAAVPELVEALDHQDKAVREAALAALGNTVTAKDLGVLISQVAKPQHAEDAAAAVQALKTAAVRMPDAEACAAEVAKALDGSPVETKIVLLETLGAVGGTKALAAVGAAAKSSNPQLQDVGTRLLGEWMTIDAAPVLLDLAKTGSGDKFTNRALRGYIRIARQFAMPAEERLEMCRKAIDACRQPADQKLVLEVLKRYPSVGMLKLAVKAAQTPELKLDGQAAAAAIAEKLPKNDEVRKLLAEAGVTK